MSDLAAPIVVGVNGSTVALRAALWAGALAVRLDAPLHIVTAMPYLGHNPSGTAAAMRAAAIAEHREGAEMILKATEEAVRADCPALEVTYASAAEPADEALTALSRMARFLVLGCDDVTATGALLVGSTTLTTLAHASCPIVAWRGHSTALTGQPVVVGVDGSGSDGGALRTAFELADRFDVPLRVIHSWVVKGPAAMMNARSTMAGDPSVHAEWQHLNALVDRWRERHPRVNVTLVGEGITAGRALGVHVKDAQLVVVGSRRRNALARRIFGSTSLRLLHHSEVPVVLCPLGERG